MAKASGDIGLNRARTTLACGGLFALLSVVAAPACVHEPAARAPAPAPAVSASSPTAQVLLVDRTTGSLQAHAPLLQRHLAAALAGTDRFSVLTRDDVRALLGGKAALQFEACDGLVCMRKALAGIPIDLLAYAQLSETAEGWRSVLTVIDAETTRVRWRVQVELPRDALYFAGASGVLAAQLRDDYPTAPLAAVSLEVKPYPPERAVLIWLDEHIDMGQPSGGRDPSGSARVVETVFSSRLLAGGHTVIDRATLTRRTGVGDIEQLSEPIKRQLGIRYVITGTARANDVGAIMGTAMHSLRGNLELRLSDARTGALLLATQTSAASGHVDVAEGCRVALRKVAERLVPELLEKIGLP